MALAQVYTGPPPYEAKKLREGANQRLWSAALHRNVEAAESAVADGAHWDDGDPTFHGATAAHYAARAGAIPLLLRVAADGVANVTAANHRGVTPLHMACGVNFAATACVLLALAPDSRMAVMHTRNAVLAIANHAPDVPDAIHDDVRTFFSSNEPRVPGGAMSHGPVTDALWCLERLEDSIAVGQWGDLDDRPPPTPPLTAAQRRERRAALVRQLLKAALSDSVPLAQSALDQGADANLPNPDCADNTPLHYAASQGAVRVTRLLFAAGALPNTRNKYNFTPLHRACTLGKSSTVAVLLALGADASARAPNGRTAAQSCPPPDAKWEALFSMLADRDVRTAVVQLADGDDVPCVPRGVADTFRHQLCGIDGTLAAVYRIHDTLEAQRAAAAAEAAAEARELADAAAAAAAAQAARARATLKARLAAAAEEVEAKQAAAAEAQRLAAVDAAVAAEEAAAAAANSPPATTHASRHSHSAGSAAASDDGGTSQAEAGAAALDPAATVGAAGSSPDAGGVPHADPGPESDGGGASAVETMPGAAAGGGESDAEVPMVPTLPLPAVHGPPTTTPSGDAQPAASLLRHGTSDSESLREAVRSRLLQISGRSAAPPAPDTAAS